MAPGTESDELQEKISRLELMQYGFSLEGFLMTLWDLYGKRGIPLRTTVSEMGLVMMAQLLKLNSEARFMEFLTLLSRNTRIKMVEESISWLEPEGGE